MQIRFLSTFIISWILVPLWAQQTAPLDIWFDTPNTLQGRLPWMLTATGMNNSDPSWENASLPIGNGAIGANIMGSVAAERITLNEKTLWTGGPNVTKDAGYYWNINKNSASLLKDIRQAFIENDMLKATRLTEENFNGLASYDSKEENPFRFGHFTTMGELYIETGLSEVNMTEYQRSLSLDSATATVSFLKDGIRYVRTSFVSYPDQVMVIRFSADQPGCQRLALSYAPNPEAVGEMKEESDNSLLYSARLKNNNMQYALRIRAMVKNGSLKAENGKLIVRDADEVVFLLTADTDYKINFDPDFENPETYVGICPLETTAQIMKNAATIGYDTLWARHQADYAALFSRVRLQLASNSRNMNDIPTPERLRRYRNGAADHDLEALYFQFGRYLLIASSRPGTLPANLQGIWHNNIDGPWHVDYHNNINIQMNYWLAHATGLSECSEPLTDFIRMLIKPGERMAQSYFGARGWTASISANIFGFTSPLSDRNMSWNFNPMAGPWLATHLWEYYDYTRDQLWLARIGYPMIKSSARFVADYLWHKSDGTYTACPSTSPEHGPIDQGATFVHAVAREILQDAIDASKELGTDRTERREWEKILEHLLPYRIGRYGQLMEWSTDIDDPKDEHRHVNHLFGLHPGRTISPITTPDLAQASRIVLEHRGDNATGWSMAWKLNQWARLHDGNHAYELLKNLLKNGTTDNLWDIHPPFQIDGNLGGTAGMVEMLLQSHMNFIHLLPSLPDAWRNGSVSGLRTRGGFIVALDWEDGRLKTCTVTSTIGGPCTLYYANRIFKFHSQKGKTYAMNVKHDHLSLVK